MKSVLGFALIVFASFAHAEPTCVARVDCKDGTSASCSGYGTGVETPECKVVNNRYTCVVEGFCASLDTDRKACGTRLVRLATDDCSTCD